MFKIDYWRNIMKKFIKLSSIIALSSLVLQAAPVISVSFAQEEDATEEVVEETQGNIEDEPRYGTTIKIAYSGALCTGDVAIAEANGYFDELGIDVELVNAQSGIDAVGTGQVDLFSTHIAEFVVPVVNGVNATFVTPVQTGCKSLYVLSDSGITSTHDLVGETIALPGGIGGSDHNITLRFLNKDEIDINSVNYKPVETAASIQAMEKGEVQAVLLSDQFAAPFVEEGTLTSIRSITWDEDFKDEPCCIHALNTDFVNENPELSKKIVSAVIKARHWTEDNNEAATDLLYEMDYASGDVDLAYEMMDSYDWKISHANTEKALLSIFTDYIEFGLITTNETPEQLLERIWNPLGIDDEYIANEIVSGL